MTKIILKSVKPHQINKISRLIRLKELIPKKNLSQNVKHLKKNLFYKFASVNKVILLVILYSQLISLTAINNYNKKRESI